RSGREAAEAGRPGRDRGRTLIEAGRGMLRAYRTFMEEAYPGQAVRTEGIVARGDVLYLPPSELPTPGGLNVVRPGVELGVVRGDRFQPSHALVLAIPPPAARDRVELELADSRI